jgi:hypothetical protein
MREKATVAVNDAVDALHRGQPRRAERLLRDLCSESGLSDCQND